MLLQHKATVYYCKYKVNVEVNKVISVYPLFSDRLSSWLLQRWCLLAWCVLLFNVILRSRCRGGGQTRGAQGVPLHQHVNTHLHITLYPWPGVCRVGEGGPLLVETVVWDDGDHRRDTSVSTGVLWQTQCGASAYGTWLFVHCGEVNLKASNVGQEEGQNPPVAHLTSNQRVFHCAYRSRTATTELTFVSMTLSKRISGYSWNSNWKFWKWTRGECVFCFTVLSRVLRCRVLPEYYYHRFCCTV